MDDLERVLKNAGINKPLMESKKPTKKKKKDSIIGKTDDLDESTEDHTVESYTKKLEDFLEAAGVGVNAEFNTWPYTPDIKKGTLKKTGSQLGFDITDAGIPPNVSKDSGVKSKK